MKQTYTEQTKRVKMGGRAEILKRGDGYDNLKPDALQKDVTSDNNLCTENFT